MKAVDGTFAKQPKFKTVRTLAMPRWVVFLWVALGMMGHLGHAAHREHVGVQELSRDAALARAKDAAKQHGYDLEAYRLSTFGADRSADGKEWLFMWECLPENHPPGCSFLAVVNRSTGEVTLAPGE